jgi:hypothetical protein
VDQPARVGVGQRPGDLRADARDLADAQRAVGEVVLERRTRHQLHDQKGLLAVAPGVV